MNPELLHIGCHCEDELIHLPLNNDFDNPKTIDKIEYLTNYLNSLDKSNLRCILIMSCKGEKIKDEIIKSIRKMENVPVPYIYYWKDEVTDYQCKAFCKAFYKQLLSDLENKRFAFLYYIPKFIISYKIYYLVYIKCIH